MMHSSPMDPTAPTNEPLATFRPDARPLTWAALAFGAQAAAGALVAWLLLSDPKLRVALASAALFVLFLAARFLLKAIVRRAEKVTLGRQRLELERGLVSRRYEAVELWRVRDVVLEQGVLDRMLSVGHLSIYSSDQTAPVLRLGPIRDAKPIYDQLRDAVAQARRDGRVVAIGS